MIEETEGIQEFVLLDNFLCPLYYLFGLHQADQTERRKQDETDRCRIDFFANGVLVLRRDILWTGD